MAVETAKARKAREAVSFYHVTTRERLQSIAETGFDPTHSRTGNGLLYLTPDLGHALGYADHHGDAMQAVVLAIKGADLDPGCLGPDDVDLPDLVGDAWEGHDWLKSTKVSGQCTYDGKLAAELFRARLCPDGSPEGPWMSLPELAQACAQKSPTA